MCSWNHANCWKVSMLDNSHKGAKVCFEDRTEKNFLKNWKNSFWIFISISFAQDKHELFVEKAQKKGHILLYSEYGEHFLTKKKRRKKTQINVFEVQKKLFENFAVKTIQIWEFKKQMFTILYELVVGCCVVVAKKEVKSELVDFIHLKHCSKCQLRWRKSLKKKQYLAQRNKLNVRSWRNGKLVFFKKGTISVLFLG